MEDEVQLQNLAKKLITIYNASKLSRSKLYLKKRRSYIPRRTARVGNDVATTQSDSTIYIYRHLQVNPRKIKHQAGALVGKSERHLEKSKQHTRTTYNKKSKNDHKDTILNNRSCYTSVKKERNVPDAVGKFETCTKLNRRDICCNTNQPAYNKSEKNQPKDVNNTSYVESTCQCSSDNFHHQYDPCDIKKNVNSQRNGPTMLTHHPHPYLRPNRPITSDVGQRRCAHPPMVPATSNAYFQSYSSAPTSKTNFFDHDFPIPSCCCRFESSHPTRPPKYSQYCGHQPVSISCQYCPARSLEEQNDSLTEETQYCSKSEQTSPVSDRICTEKIVGYNFNDTPTPLELSCKDSLTLSEELRCDIFDEFPFDDYIHGYRRDTIDFYQGTSTPEPAYHFTENRRKGHHSSPRGCELHMRPETCNMNDDDEPVRQPKSPQRPIQYNPQRKKGDETCNPNSKQQGYESDQQHANRTSQCRPQRPFVPIEETQHHGNHEKPTCHERKSCSHCQKEHNTQPKPIPTKPSRNESCPKHCCPCKQPEKKLSNNKIHCDEQRVEKVPVVKPWEQMFCKQPGKGHNGEENERYPCRKGLNTCCLCPKDNDQFSEQEKKHDREFCCTCKQPPANTFQEMNDDFCREKSIEKIPQQECINKLQKPLDNTHQGNHSCQEHVATCQEKNHCCECSQPTDKMKYPEVNPCCQCKNESCPHPEKKSSAKKLWNDFCHPEKIPPDTPVHEKNTYCHCKKKVPPQQEHPPNDEICEPYRPHNKPPDEINQEKRNCCHCKNQISLPQEHKPDDGKLLCDTYFPYNKPLDKTKQEKNNFCPCCNEMSPHQEEKVDDEKLLCDPYRAHKKLPNRTDQENNNCCHCCKQATPHQSQKLDNGKQLCNTSFPHNEPLHKTNEGKNNFCHCCNKMPPHQKEKLDDEKRKCDPHRAHNNSPERNIHEKNNYCHCCNQISPHQEQKPTNETLLCDPCYPQSKPPENKNFCHCKKENFAPPPQEQKPKENSCCCKQNQPVNQKIQEQVLYCLCEKEGTAEKAPSRTNVHSPCTQLPFSQVQSKYSSPSFIQSLLPETDDKDYPCCNKPKGDGDQLAGINEDTEAEIKATLHDIEKKLDREVEVHKMNLRGIVEQLGRQACEIKELKVVVTSAVVDKKKSSIFSRSRRKDT